MTNALLEMTFPRRHVPAGLSAGDWPAVSAWFDRIERELDDARTDLAAWLESTSEFAAVLQEELSRRHVAMTCRTEDKEAERRFLEYVQELDPKFKPRWFAILRKLLVHPRVGELSGDRWFVLLRSLRNEVELFRPENVTLEAEEQKLSQQHKKVMGAMTVTFDGQERTLPQMELFQEERDRDLRRRAFEAVAARRLQDREELDRIYDEMIALRDRMARNAGLSDYRAYAFRRRERFDYTPEHCLDFHRSMEEIVVPRLRKLHAERKRLLGVDPLRPWDLSVDPRNEPPLRPFADAERLYQGCREMFARVGPEFAEFFAFIHARGNLDLETRKGKAPGGYQTTFAVERVPFIFMNAAGLNADVFTLLHEGGHAFHSLLARAEPILEYRHAPIEFCEVASMGMELLAERHLDVFYPPAEAARARRNHFEAILKLLPWVATIDAFQHWIYLSPRHTRDERTAHWRELRRRFGGLEDWTGMEAARDAAWQRQSHLYGVPFYYIEYGIAQVGALQLWSRYRRDPAGAVAGYRRALALGGSRPLPELFAAAGLRFDFSAATIAPLIDEVEAELA